MSFIKSVKRLPNAVCNLPKRAYWAFVPMSSVCPSVIVLGKEKSGTTAIAALLAQYTARSVTLDIPSLWGRTEKKLYSGRVSFEKYARHNKGAFSASIVKEPGLTFLYPKVKRCFPDAKIVMITRDPRDNIRSVLNRLDLPGNQRHLDSATFQNLPSTWKVVIDSSWLGVQADSYIDMAAKRWNRAVDMYLKYSDQMELVLYEDFNDDKVGSIARLSDRLGLSHKNDISDIVDVQYQPKGNRSVSWKEFYGKKNLSRIKSICHKRMVKLGYS